MLGYTIYSTNFLAIDISSKRPLQIIPFSEDWIGEKKEFCNSFSKVGVGYKVEIYYKPK